MEQTGISGRHRQLAGPRGWASYFGWFAGLYLVTASWVGSSPATVDLLQYHWEVSTAAGEYASASDRHPTAETIIRHLKTARKVKADERDHPDSHAGPHADLLHYLRHCNSQLTSLHLKGRSVIGPDAIAILGQFANLESLTIIIPPGTSLALAGNLGTLGALNRLAYLFLDLSQVKLAAVPVEFTNSALETVVLRHQSFAHPIRFSHCPELVRVDLWLPRLPALSLAFPHGEVLAHAVSLTVHSNALVHLPAVLLHNPQVYLNLSCDLSDDLALEEHTEVVGVALRPGADALLNLVGSSISQHGTPIMCCSAEEYPNWAALDDHYTRAHPQQHRYLATRIHHHRVAVPCPRPAPSARYRHHLTPAELRELAAFFSAAPVKAIEILKGKVSVGLNLGAMHEQQPVLTLAEWHSMLAHISLLHLAATDAAIPIPRCFYKLYTLASLTIDDCWLPNLLEIVAAMPGLRQLEISSSTFDYAGYLASDFFRQVRMHNPQKTVALINCQSEEDVKSGHLLLGLLVLAAFLVVVVLYAISVAKMNRARGQVLAFEEQRPGMSAGPHLIRVK